MKELSINCALIHCIVQGRFIEKSRNTLNKYLNNCNSSDDKLVMFVGPCSVHNYDECLEYTKFIKKSIFISMSPVPCACQLRDFTNLHFKFQFDFCL